jgi:hypothetical protein
MSDLLYNSPYDAYVGPETKGGYVGTETLNGSACDHLSFQDSAADYQLWVSQSTSLPCKLIMTYKDDEPEKARSAQIIFSKWNLTAKASDQDFIANIPAGYERIPIMERVRLKEESKSGNQTQSN